MKAICVLIVKKKRIRNRLKNLALNGISLDSKSQKMNDDENWLEI